MNTRPVRVALGIIGVLVVFFAGYFIYMQYQNGMIKIPLLPDKPLQDESSPLVTKNEKGEAVYSDKFYEEAKTKNIDELSKNAPDLTNQINIAETSAREKFVKDVLKDREPQNHMIEYSSRLSTSGVMILQGDYITIMNKSQDEINVIKKDRVLIDPSIDESMQTLPPASDSSRQVVSEFKVNPGEMLSLNFDFLGKFNFTVNGVPLEVNVVSSYE